MRAALILLTLSACVTSPWDGTFPKSGSQITSETQRQQDFDKFAISDMQATGFNYIVKTQPQAGQTNYYKLETLAPVIEKIYPEGRKRILDLQASNKYFYMAVGTSITLVVAPIYFPLSLFGMGSIWLWQIKLGENFALEYNTALRQNSYSKGKE